MSFTKHYYKENDINKQPLIDYAKKYKSAEELLRSGGFPIDLLDKVAHGFSRDDVTQLHPDKLNIKWHDDFENVEYEVEKSGKSPIVWSKQIDLSEPIEVSYENGKFWIEDGHHRYYAAKTLNKLLNVELDIKDKPIRKILNKTNYDYDEFHKDIFDLSRGE